MKLSLLAVLSCALLAPSMASAQTDAHVWFASPFVGTPFKGNATASRPAFGAAGGWLGTRLGFEGEVADSPDFFEQTGFLTYRRVTTVMGSALMQFGNSATRAYAAGGAGLVRPHLAEAGSLRSVDENSLGFNVGGGVMGLLSNHTAVRGDVRYIRTARSKKDDNTFGLDLSGFEFWRAYAGLVVKF